jgi:6-phosphogluconolactonase
MTFAVEVFPSGKYAENVAELVTAALPASGHVIITGGTTAALVYRATWNLDAWDELDIWFSDERCVPPEEDASNFRMAMEALLAATRATVHRMQGELEPDEGARHYHDEIAPAIAAGPAVALMGMGADCHVGALYPGSPALDATNYCAAVDRPDGLQGLTLTPPAMLAVRSVRLIATGDAKAEAVRRVVTGEESPATCPVRLLAPHPDVTLYLDDPAASLL